MLTHLDFDRVRNTTFQDDNDRVVVKEEVDRTYFKAPAKVLVYDGSQVITVEKDGFADCVVWNPWQAKAKAMADFGDEEYHQMIACEVGQIEKPVLLVGNGVWIGRQTIRAAL